ncbi:xanthine dehydrogenase family protein molybdopterin-binding subunit [Mycolicibacterium sp. F2034L]|uniref:xanthine dehydrogenase family protein molybdopterin-binding subunit n=1 Tax=Mycolicibacterium sp. F2034L TaxID=2926422 RepID=UPI001FF6EF78|nr:xanthine dehydrogenase family protein molybdopterin-binding subunit [Mycolicibacterium sp. F2034L]MCK0174699.1 xanthine dehydrogenase family protein molybdopterin-binding subunit [Mycolicibacterium sp. F2034L]
MTASVDRTDRSVDRVEGSQKVTGTARYTADLTLPGQVHAVLVQSEIPHGRVTEESMRHSAERVSSAPGVRYVLTPLNCPHLNVLPEVLTWDLPLERRPPLSDLTVQHVGQHMALVVADTLEEATAAAATFDLSYETYPPQLDAREVPPAADGQVGPIRHGSYAPDHFVKLSDEKLQDRRGVPPAGATKRVAARFTTPHNAHYPIELSATIAAWADDRLTVHDSTRWITGERTALAAYLGIPEDRIRVLSPLVGGAFGSKSFLWMHVVLCAVAARETGRPVKLVLTRDQMFSSTGHRPRTEQDLALLADDDGRILSTEHHTLTETSTVAHFCEPTGLSTRFLYTSQHLDVSHRTARLNAPTPCFMRGPGEAPGLFALEVAIDELAYQTGLDPLELRVRNHADTEQVSGKPWSGKHLLECYRTGAQRFGWADRPPAPRALLRNGVAVGWGMATATYPGRRMPAGCRVVTGPDGAVRFASATHEIGNGVRTVMTQVAADITGLPPSRITFESGDSHFPAAPYSGASQTTATVGAAVHAAATEWKRRIRSLAGECTDHIDLAAIAGAHHEELSFTADSDAGDEGGRAVQSFGAHFCEVEVDQQIGRATVTRWVAVMDCGRVLNPKLARSQVMGGITFGIGMAMLEEVPYDADTAQMIGEYYLPTHADRPEFDVSFVERADFDLNPIGVRGVGEIGTCGVPAAIANAIFHATGKRLRNLPIRVEDLMIPYRSPITEEP